MHCRLGTSRDLLVWPREMVKGGETAIGNLQMCLPVVSYSGQNLKREKWGTEN